MAAAFALSVTFAFSEPSATSLDRILEPSIGLREMSDAVLKDGGASLPTDKFFIMTGRLGVMMDRSGESGPFAGECELVGGEWSGMDSVRSFRAYLRFKGAAFADLADNEAPGYIKPGTLVAVIGSFAGTMDEYGSGKKVGVVEVRRLIRVE
jgi:hypothetical protein